MLLVATSVLLLGLNPKVARRVVLRIPIFVIDILTSELSFTVLLDHQTPCGFPRVIPAALLRLFVVVLVLFFVISRHNIKGHL
jgi:hypothetical protein